MRARIAHVLLSDKINHLRLGENLIITYFESAVVEVGGFPTNHVNKAFVMKPLVKQICELGCILE